MARQRIFYTTLPRGVNPSTGKHRVSVFITPRLETTRRTLKRGSAGGRLDEFPDWVDWPETVRDRIDWTLEVSADGEDFEPDATITSPTPVSDAWTDLCPPDSLLETSTGPLPLPFGDRYVVSMPEKSLSDYLVNTLIGLAANPDEPDDDAVRAAYAAINLYDPDRDDLNLDDQLAEIIDQLAERGTVRNDDPGRTDLAIAQALLLKEPTLENLRAACETARGGAGKRAGTGAILGGEPPRPEDPPSPPRLDVHQAASAAGSHPYLLRLLGLVVDFEFTPPASLLGSQPRQANFSFQVSLDSLMPSGGIIQTPRLLTRCLISATMFEAAPRRSAPLTERGLLRLADPNGSKPKYAITQVDVQGGAQQMLEDLVKRDRSLKIYKDDRFLPSLRPPPPLRSAGVSVTDSTRAASLWTSYQRQVDLNRRMMQTGGSAPPVFLDREDITRGYAFDVFDTTSNRWYSLCRRVGRARFGSAADDQSPGPLPGDITWEDEGWVTGGVTSGYGENDTVKRVTEAFATWANGWSMVTQRPGKSVSPAEIAVERTQEVGDFKLAVRYAAKPGSLPPQRFGRSYRLRARAIDLAGNAITSDEASALGSPHVLQTTYRRYEPVPPPTILMRTTVTEGESPDLVVIRSNFGTAAGSTSPSDRHVFPASFDEFRSECHGMFDVAGGISPSVYDKIAGRESGAFDARDSSGDFIHPNAQPDPLNYDAPYFDVDTPQFEVEGGSLARMPSLPDPMSGGLAFRGLPGAPQGSNQIYDIYRGGATWPDVKPVRLRVFESASFVAPALVGDELRVGLPKGESRVVDVSSSLVPSRADHMAILALLDPALRQGIIDGRYWAVTPARKLRLVHAVRQPLRATEFNNLLETRRSGDTGMQLEDTMLTSRKSTERVEVYADWVEKTDYLPVGVDELHEPERWEPEREVPVTSKVFERGIDTQGPDGSLPIDERHELHTTRHIPAISYRTVATTRFKEYFRERAEVTLTVASPTAGLPSAYSGPAAGIQAVAEDSERVTSLDGTRTFERNQPGEDAGHYTMDYEAGTITRFDVGDRDNMPNQVRVTYIKREITRPSPAPTVKRALSTRRPDPPKLLYAMPTFRRNSFTDPNTYARFREAMGLRVFLDRPWWSSGDEELLGVVMTQAATTAGIEHLTTRQGQDSIWGGDPVTEKPFPLDFTAAVDSRSDLQVPGAPSDRQFTVAGHAVKPDTENLRWYCDLDIRLQSEPYTPFIRLALARYQPNALIGLELSPVVQLDYMQLYPDRYASVYRQSETSVNVYIGGLTYDGGRFQRSTGSTVPRASVIEAQVEQRRPDMEGGDELFGWIPRLGAPPVELEFFEPPEGQTGWTGDLDVSGTERERIVIREYEQFGPQVGGKFQRRLVYAEAIDVPPLGGGDT